MSHHLHVKYLLVGGGLASSSAAEAIRETDREGSIVLIGLEHTRPYHRPPLSKDFLRGQQTRDELFTVPVGWFSDANVELHTGLRAVQVDVVRKSVALANGDVFAYDRLLLATGGTAKHLTMPGSHLPNVHYLRNLDDADRLHNAIEKAKREGRPHPAGTGGRGLVTVIGGGILGVELASTLSQLGLSVDLIVASAHPWKKFAGEATGKFIQRHLEKNGVRVHTAVEPSRLEGEGRVQRVILSDGRSVVCDFVVAAVGMTPNKDLLRGTPIIAEKAILTDAHCRTSIPDVYAAGDCAAVFDPLFGKHRVMEHWDAAKATGKIAGQNMAGMDRTFDHVTQFDTMVFGLRLRAFGSCRHVARRLLRGLPHPELLNEFVEIGVAADGRVAQVLTFSSTLADEALRGLVQRRLNVEGREEQLKDPGTALP